ncbi:MAG: ABATE domain-containing protein [Aeromicrobium sp.]
METPQWRPRELPIVGGHLALDFANTVDDPLGPERWDHIATADGLLHWAGRVAIPLRVTANRVDEGSLLRQAHELRDTLNAVFGAIADGGSVDDADWRRLRTFVAEAMGDADLVQSARGSALALDWSGLDDLRVVLHPVAAAAQALLAGDDLGRLKRCGRCPWLFLDQSKNLSRRWCDMNDCGRAEKIERYVARRAARRGAASSGGKDRGPDPARTGSGSGPRSPGVDDGT